MHEVLEWANRRARLMGEGLRVWRTANEMSLRDFSKLCGLSVSTLSRFETGRTITIEHGFAITRAIELHKRATSGRME